ncbi:MAG TPA: hypothetical protein VFB54_03665 [Burkholderiales bacterium]|nr:hypothetical protein [Burkholderiales bacterium]
MDNHTLTTVQGLAEAAIAAAKARDTAQSQFDAAKATMDDANVALSSAIESFSSAMTNALGAPAPFTHNGYLFDYNDVTGVYEFDALPPDLATLGASS